MALFWICTLVLLLDVNTRLGALEAILPAGLLLLVAWDLFSALWAPSLTGPMLEAQLALVYVGAALAALLVVRRGTYRALLGGIVVAITLVSAYGLATRLFPERLGSVDDLAGYRLAQPLGYWNALGIFAALGTLLAAGFAARGNGVVVRSLAGASTLILVPTLYFTFGRGPWISLGIGLLTILVVERHRVQFIVVGLVLLPWLFLAVWLASRSRALTSQGTALSAASHAGHTYAVILVLLTLGAGLSVAGLCVVGARVRIRRSVFVVFRTALVYGAVALLVATFMRYGSPVKLARNAYGSFLVSDTPTLENGDLNKRLLSLANNGRIDGWRIAWSEYRLHPLLGSGSGSYERYWNQMRPSETKIRDAHNLYLETLAETGPVGLVILLVALLAPFAVVMRARRRRLGAFACGAYVAFLAHAAIDWDWEMPAVTVTAVFCAVAMIVCARSRIKLPPLRRPIAFGLAAASLLLGVGAFLGLQGNRAVAASEGAASSGRPAKSAHEARRVISWAPWSSRGWQLLGEAQFQQGDNAAARVSFLKAISKDGEDWSIWLDLAVASKGAQQKHAFDEATRLNPLSSAVAAYRQDSRGASR